MTPEERKEYESRDAQGKKRLTMIWKKRKKREYEERGEELPEWLKPRKRIVRTARAKKNGKPGAVPKAVKEAQVEKVKKNPMSVSQMRGQVQAMMEKHDLDPIEELIIHCKSSSVPKKEKVQIYKFLVPYLTPTLKAVDVQQDLKMNVSVNLQSFDGARISDMKTAEPVAEEEYEEFLTDDNKIEMEQSPDLAQSESDMILNV
jgi:hypothetical protein